MGREESEQTEEGRVQGATPFDSSFLQRSCSELWRDADFLSALDVALMLRYRGRRRNEHCKTDGGGGVAVIYVPRRFGFGIIVERACLREFLFSPIHVAINQPSESLMKS
ncbi:hypothetical protein NL676_016340 [Syzygium grande]|nr:hypothetical protein NL676_016340 [Syzygium grande]